MVRLGAAAGPRGIRVMPPFFCYIRGESDNLLSFAKQTGTELPGGWLYPDDEKRYVFLGARQRRPGDTSLAYGAERVRDVVGVAERIGSFRWRLEIRGPSRDGLDVYELTPVPGRESAACSPEVDVTGPSKRVKQDAVNDHRIPPFNLSVQTWIDARYVAIVSPCAAQFRRVLHSAR